jgi:methylenetetrahydrofolate reductase (NADPH)
MAGVIPVKSVGAARYMQKFVSGLDIPNELINRLKAADDVKKEGINISIEILERLQEIEGVAGAHIMAIMWEEKIPEITERAGLLPRPVV